MFPSRFVVFGGTWLIAVDARHAEVCGHVQIAEPQAVVELLHPGEVEINHVVVPRKVSQREAWLYAVIIFIAVWEISYSVHACLYGHALCYAYAVVVEYRYLTDKLMAWAQVVAECGEVVSVERIFSAPSYFVYIVGRI